MSARDVVGWREVWVVVGWGKRGGWVVGEGGGEHEGSDDECGWG